MFKYGRLENTHIHKPLENAINLVGKTNERDLIQLMYNARGVLTPVSFPMHLAAAVPTRDNRYRPCIVLAGGREPVTWEQYPGHQFLHSIGMLDCCRHSGCWKSRAEKLNDNDEKDNSLCRHPIKTEESTVGKCMDMITPEEVVEKILKYEDNY